MLKSQGPECRARKLVPWETRVSCDRARFLLLLVGIFFPPRRALQSDGFLSTVTPAGEPDLEEVEQQEQGSRPRPTETRTTVAMANSDWGQTWSQRIARPCRTTSAKSSQLACATVARC